MTDINDFLEQDDPWHEVLRTGPIPAERRCILLWVQRAQRATENRAANLAVQIGNALKLPVVALFVLDLDYPSATGRAYRFMIEGLTELPDAFAARGIGWVIRAGDPVAEAPKFAFEAGAAAVVTDFDPLRIARGWKSAVAERLTVPMVSVATDSIAPPAAFPKLEYAARTIRPKLWRLVAAEPAFLEPVPTTRATAPRLHVDPGPDPRHVPGTKKPVGRESFPGTPGGARAGHATLTEFIAERLAGYPALRNRPEAGESSRLSAYLHFGQISPLAVARAVISARVGDSAWESPKGKAIIGTGNAIVDDPLQTFLDELVTQRELGINFCLREPAYDAWEGLPDWGQRTLMEHLKDPRPATYPAASLEAGETGDALWNAAQRQMVQQGYMPNRLRMYWAKQLLQWTTHPEGALEIAIDLNDRFQLDGRDANGYANISWAIGGRHDRPFPPRKPILGLIRPMSARGMARSFDTDAYIRDIEQATGEPVPGERPRR